jgi:hypothetical protein
MKIVHQEQHAQCEHDCGPHDAARFATVTGAGALGLAEQTPAPRKQPASEANQD